MKNNLFLLTGLFLFTSFTFSQNTKSGRELIGSSAHFNFYADASNAHYWDTIMTPMENKYTMFRGLLDYPGGIDSIFTSSSTLTINLHSSHEALNSEYNGTLADWKCGFYQKTSKTLHLCLPETTVQIDYYDDLTTLAFNIFSQLVFELNLNRRGGNSYPDYFKEGVGLYYSGFKPDPQTVDDYVNGLGHNLVINDLYDITNIATTGLKDLVATRIEASAMTTYTSKFVTPGWGDDIWQSFVPLFYQNEEDERMQLQYSSENFDFYSIEKDIQYIADIAASFETKCADYQEQFEMTYDHRFNILVLPYTETWSLLTNWGNSNGASAMQNENVFMSSIDYCYDSDLNSYLNSLIPHEYGHVNHAHMYWDIPSGFYAEGMADYSANGIVDPSTNYNLWKIDVVFDSYMSTYDRLPTFDEFLENPNQDIDPYFFGHAFTSFIAEFYGGAFALKTFFNEGMVFSALNTSKENIEYYYIKYLEYLRDWDTNSPEAAFESEILGGTESTMDVKFTDISTSGASSIIEWYWEFGDGTTSTEQHPTHTYSGVGSYTVYMTASDGDLYDFEYKVDYVTVEDNANYGPEIIDWEPEALSHEIIVDSTLNFSVTATDPNGDDIDYTWSVDNDVQSETSSAFTYNFDELGTFTIECVVSDGEFTDDISWTIVVNEENVAPTIISWEPLELSHEIYSDSTLFFSITATDVNDDELEYTWFINTNTQSESTNEFNYNFSLTGTFNVKCVVSDGEYSDQKIWTIIVLQSNLAPSIISWEPVLLSHETYADSMMTFGVTATDPNLDELEYKWSVNLLDQEEPDSEFAYYFNELGNYTVQCIVSDGELTDEKSWTVNVYPVGINDVDLQEVNVYPNPCIDVLNISTPENFGEYDLHIYRINGDKILNYSGVNACASTILIDNLKSGIYFTIIENDEQVIRRKFIKK